QPGPGQFGRRIALDYAAVDAPRGQAFAPGIDIPLDAIGLNVGARSQEEPAQGDAVGLERLAPLEQALVIRRFPALFPGFAKRLLPKDLLLERIALCGETLR